MEAAWRQVDAHLLHRHRLARALVAAGAPGLAQALAAAEGARAEPPARRLAQEERLAAGLARALETAGVAEELRADLASTNRRLEATLRIYRRWAGALEPR